ncbi:DUF6034 family protein [Lachnospiraceae bacterium 46-15]
MRKQRLSSLGMLCAAMLLAGCQPTTDIAIVEPKKGVAGVKMVDETAVGSVLEQVQAPEKCAMEFEDEESMVKVVIDADVSVPDVEGIRLKKTETRVFEQKDMDNLKKNLMQGSSLWRRTESGKKEINANVLYDRYRAERYGSEADWVPDKEGGNDSPNLLWGGVTVDGIDYNFLLDNNWSAQRKNVLVCLSKGEYAEEGNFSTYGADGIESLSRTLKEKEYMARAEKAFGLEHAEQAVNKSASGAAEADVDGGEYFITENMWKLKTSAEELQAQADAQVKDLGFQDMELAAVRECGRYDSSLEGYAYSYGMEMVYTRNIDGIPVTYAQYRNVYDEMQRDYSEALALVYDDEGLAQMIWKNPSEVSDMSEEYVFLLPFSDILQIFQREAAEIYREYSARKMLLIREIKLGYMWLPDTSTETEGMLIPVWDFLGSCVSHWMADEKMGIEEQWSMDSSDCQSFLAVNAMDGTLVRSAVNLY